MLGGGERKHAALSNSNYATTLRIRGMALSVSVNGASSSLAFAVFPLCLFIYVWLFNFIDGLPRHALITRLSSHQGRMHLLRTAFSIGFLKSSIRRCGHHFYRLVVNPRSRARIGEALPEDCRIFSLATGQHVLLSSLLSSAGDKPFVLTFGSWS